MTKSAFTELAKEIPGATPEQVATMLEGMQGTWQVKAAMYGGYSNPLKELLAKIVNNMRQVSLAA